MSTWDSQKLLFRQQILQINLRPACLKASRIQMSDRHDEKLFLKVLCRVHLKINQFSVLPPISNLGQNNNKAIPSLFQICSGTPGDCSGSGVRFHREGSGDSWGCSPWRTWTVPSTLLASPRPSPAGSPEPSLASGQGWWHSNCWPVKWENILYLPDKDNKKII